MEAAKKQQTAFSSGFMEVKVDGGDSFMVDIYRTKLSIEKFEQKHDPYKEGWVFTEEAIDDLLAAFERSGTKGLSASLAIEIWSQINECWESAKKKWGFMQTSSESTESALSDTHASN